MKACQLLLLAAACLGLNVRSYAQSQWGGQASSPDSLRVPQYEISDPVAPALPPSILSGIRIVPEPFAQTAAKVGATSPNTPAPLLQPDGRTCAPGQPHSKACKLKVGKALLQTFGFLSIEMSVDLAMDPIERGKLEYALSHGQFWENYWKTLQNFRYTVYNDDDTVLTTYVGHPMMGSELEFIWLQNNPKYRSLEFSNSKAYWGSRLWAMIPTTIFSVEWLLGPLSESSMGNQGIGYYHDPADHNKWTNGTGFGDFIVTPVGGALWAAGEDWLDLHVAKKIRMRSRNPGLLFISALITPTKSGANILRFKAPWYRDAEQASPIPAD